MVGEAGVAWSGGGVPRGCSAVRVAATGPRGLLVRAGSVMAAGAWARRTTSSRLTLRQAFAPVRERHVLRMRARGGPAVRPPLGARREHPRSGAPPPTRATPAEGEEQGGTDPGETRVTAGPLPQVARRRTGRGGRATPDAKSGRPPGRGPAGTHCGGAFPREEAPGPPRPRGSRGRPRRARAPSVRRSPCGTAGPRPGGRTRQPSQLSHSSPNASSASSVRHRPRHSTTSQPRRAASARKAGLGLITTGWPTSSKSGVSATLSE